jgi:hypothetical protein
MQLHCTVQREGSSTLINQHMVGLSPSSSLLQLRVRKVVFGQHAPGTGKAT